MRTLIDTECPACGHITRDVWRIDGELLPPCAHCAGATWRCWTIPAASAAVQSDVDVTIRHGLCWPDGTPRHFSSRRDLRQAERAAGLTNAVEHHDDSLHTQRFV